MHAFADIGGSPAPRSWWLAWNADPVLLLNLLLVSHLYARGVRRLWRSGPGRGVTAWQVAAFAGGMLALAAALVSPLDALSARLASAHMVQHMLLMTAAAPLLVVGSPALVVLSGVPEPYRGALGRAWRRFDGDWLWHPVVVWGAFAGALWVWHLPVLYEAALRSLWVHDAEHLTFFAAALVFWRAILDPIGRRRLHPLVGVSCLFATSLHATALGVFLALSPRPWYAEYEARTGTFGLTALEDQQLAGLIMWVPAGVVFVGLAGAVLVAGIGKQEEW
jgi:putative membrane protein